MKWVRRVQVEFRCSMVGCKKFWCVGIEIKCWEEFSSKPEVIAHFAHRQPCLARMTWDLESVEPSLSSRLCTSIDSCLMSCMSLVKAAFVSFVRFRRCTFVRNLRTSKVPSKVRRYEGTISGLGMAEIIWRAGTRNFCKLASYKVLANPGEFNILCRVSFASISIIY